MPDMSRPKVVIFSQGDEVISGATIDTNAAYLADHCRTLGFNIVRHITVADELDDLVQVLKDIDALADICLCTGGLGPTQDDLTTEAYSNAFKAPLVFDETAMSMMQDYFGQLSVDMPEVNRKQALLPDGAIRIDNHWGTAAGFIGVAKRCRFYFMPGVPFEMKNMMQATVIDNLRACFKVEKPRLITLRTMGMGESAIQQEMDALSLADDIRVSFRAGLPENELKLIFPNHYSDADLKRCVEEVREVLGDSVYAIDGMGETVANLADCVHQLMRQYKQSLTVLESLSQGRIGQQCHVDWLQQSAVLPQTSAILSRVGMGSVDINESTVVDIALKEHAQNASSITLVQLCKNEGDDVIAVTAVVSDESCKSASKKLTGRLQRQQIVASAQALNLLRKFLLENEYATY
ncbi:MAG TPA: competence/damage-inducible protein A [Cycloclasticus sp.]|nr:competence/damage-inducible protein A [Cycloclasticus sp.]